MLEVYHSGPELLICSVVSVNVILVIVVVVCWLILVFFVYRQCFSSASDLQPSCHDEVQSFAQVMKASL